MVKDPYTQEELSKDEFPAYVAQGSILKVVFKEINAFNEDKQWTELILLMQVANTKFMVFSFTTGNRWLSEQIVGEKNGSIKAVTVIELLKRTPNVEVIETRLLGHLNDIDLYSFLAVEG